MTQPIAGRLGGSRILWLVVLLLIGGYFRVVAIQETVVTRPIRADALDYALTAYNLVHHGVYSRSPSGIVEPAVAPQPDAYRSPGMPLMIAPFVSLWPDRVKIASRIQVINAVLGLVAVAAIFFAASTVLPLPAAIGVGLLTATAPHLISLGVYVLSETPGCCLVAVLLAAGACGVPEQRWRRIAYFSGLGAIVGALALFRPAFLAFAPLMALAFPKRRDKWHALAWGCLAAGLVMAPWVIRNVINVPPDNGPSLLATVMLEGSYRGLIYNGDAATFPNGAHADPRFETLRMSLPATIAEVTRKFFADPWVSLWWYLVEKTAYLFQWNNIDGIGDVFVYAISASPFRSNELFNALHWLYRKIHLPFLLLAGIGAAAAWWPAAIKTLPSSKAHVMRMASLILIFLYLVHMPLMVNTRYSLPAYPAMHLLAMFALVLGLRLVWTFGRAPSPTVAVSAGGAAAPTERSTRNRRNTRERKGTKQRA